MSAKMNVAPCRFLPPSVGGTLVASLFLVILAPGFGLNLAYGGDETAGRSLATLSDSRKDVPAQHRPRRADFARERASPDVRYLADWILDAGDNLAMPFVLVDKRDARVYVFHADGRLRGVAAALLGLAVGDDAVPGIGERKLSSIRPDERTTPAGRFVASLDHNLHGGEILWVDYEGAISLHPVITSNPREQRAQRLSTPTPLDNRISYGCINVPAEFFLRVVKQAFTGTSGVVYVLPETRPLPEVFASYDVEERSRWLAVNPGPALPGTRPGAVSVGDR